MVVQTYYDSVLKKWVVSNENGPITSAVMIQKEMQAEWDALEHEMGNILDKFEALMTKAKQASVKIKGSQSQKATDTVRQVQQQKDPATAPGARKRLGTFNTKTKTWE